MHGNPPPLGSEPFLPLPMLISCICMPDVPSIPTVVEDKVNWVKDELRYEGKEDAVMEKVRERGCTRGRGASTLR